MNSIFKLSPTVYNSKYAIKSVEGLEFWVRNIPAGFEFDKSSHYYEVEDDGSIVIPGHSSLDTGNKDFTITFNVKTENAVEHVLMERQGGGFFIIMNADGTLFVSAGSAIVEGSVAINDGTPHYIAIVFNLETGISLYIDGVLDAQSATINSQDIAGAGTPVGIYNVDYSPANYALDLNGAANEYATMESYSDVATFDISTVVGDTVPSGWSKIGSYVASKEENTIPGGGTCLKLAITANNQGVYKNNILTAGTEYKLTLRYKSSSAITIGNVTVDDVYFTLPASGEWTIATKTFVAVTNGNLNIYSTAADNIFISSFTLVKDHYMDLNSHEEFISHTKNTDFEISTTDTSITPQTEYMVEFNNKHSLFENFEDGLYTGWTVASGAGYRVISDTPVSGGARALECTNSGIISIPSTQAYGTWEFDWYNAGSGDSFKIYFISPDASASSNYYYFQVDDASGVIRLRSSSGIMLATASSYVTGSTWYRVKIERTLAGAFSVYISGGTFGSSYVLVDLTGGAGTNPITNNTYTTSAYLVLDLDTGDKIANICLTKDSSLWTTNEYLTVALPTDLAEFNPASSNGGWANWAGNPTNIQVTTEPGSSNCRKITFTATAQGLMKAGILLPNKKYKLSIRYKSTLGFNLGAGGHAGSDNLSLPATSQWNTVIKTITTANTISLYSLIIWNNSVAGDVFIESITCRLDQKLDLNEEAELIKHSLNRDFEQTYSASPVLTNTGYSGTTDWTSPTNEGIAQGISSRQDYSMDFNGTSEYLSRTMPTNLLSNGTFESGINTDEWAVYGVATFNDTELGKTGAHCLKIVSASGPGIYKNNILVTGKKYKISFRYKSTLDFGIGDPGVNSSAYGGVTATSQWNTVVRTFTAQSPNIMLYRASAGTIWLDDISIKEDWKLDLNEEYELIKHSKNWNFEETSTAGYSSNFTSSVDGFITQYSATPTFNQTIDGVTGALKVTSDGTTTTFSVVRSSTFTSGKRYRYKASVYIPSTASITHVEVYNGYTPVFLVTTKGVWVTKEIEFTHFPGDTTSSMWLIANSSVASVGNVFYVKDIVVYEIDNLVINGTCAGTFVDGLAPNWSWAGVVTRSEGVGYSGGKAQRFSSNLNLLGGNVRAILKQQYYAGKKYKLSFWARISEAGVGNTIMYGLSSTGWLTTAALTTSVSLTEVVITPTGTDNVIFFGCGTNDETTIYQIDDVSLTEIYDWAATGNHSVSTSILDKYEGTQSLKIVSTASGRGSELITVQADREFSSDTGFWSKDAGWTISGGTANYNSTTPASLAKSNLLTIGKTYEILVTATRVSGTLRVYAGTNYADITQSGSYILTLTCAGTTTFFFNAVAPNGFNGTVDNVSIKEVLGEVSLPSSQIDTLVSGNKYTLEGWAKVDPASLTYGSNLIPAASSSFGTDGTAYWNRRSGTVSWNNTDFCLTFTVTGLDVAGLIAASNVSGSGIYKVKFKARSATYTGKMFPNGYGEISSTNTVKTLNPNMTSVFQEYEYVIYCPSLSVPILYTEVAVPTGTVIEFDDITLVKASLLSLSNQIGSKSVSITPQVASWTKFVLNFEATTTEVNQDLKLYLDGAGSVWVDKLSLTQAYDMAIIANARLNKTTNGILGTNLATPFQLGFSTTSPYFRNEVGLSNTNYAEAISTDTVTDNTWHILKSKIIRDGNLVSQVDSGSEFTSSLSSIGKHIFTQNIQIGKTWVNYLSGQLGSIQFIRFNNIGLSNYNSTTHKIGNRPTNSDTVAYYNWQGSNLTEMLSDKSGTGNDLSATGITADNREALPLDNYALDFNGTDEYLTLPLSADLASFNPSTATGGNAPTGWSKNGTPTISYVTDEPGSSGCLKIVTSSNTQGIFKVAIKYNKLYKIVLRYKSNGGFSVNDGGFGGLTLAGGVKPTAEWNTISFLIKPNRSGQVNDDNGVYILADAAGTTIWIESITIKLDQKLDLNKDQEMILHSKNWNFERTLITSYTSDFSNAGDVNSFSNSTFSTITLESGVNNIGGQNSVLKLTTTGNTGFHFITKIPVTGANISKVKLDVYIPSSNVTSKRFGIIEYASTSFISPVVTETDRWITIEADYRGNFSNYFYMAFASALNETNYAGTAGDVMYIKNITYNTIPNLITNGEFTTDLTGWSVLSGTVTWESGKVKFLSAGGVICQLTQTKTIGYKPYGKYRVTFETRSSTLSTNSFRFRGNPVDRITPSDYYQDDNGVSLRTVGLHTITLAANTAANTAPIIADFVLNSGTPDGEYIEIDNVHLYEIPEWAAIGNHSVSTSMLDKYEGTQSLKVTATGTGDVVGVTDNFSDGDYTGWTVQSGTFTVSTEAPLSGGTKALKCTGAGHISIPSTQAYGSWEFDLYKGADGNSARALFINNSTGKVFGTYTGYELYFSSTERFGLARSNVNADLAYSAVSYIANSTWYRVKVIRSIDGVFSFFIKGGAFGTTDWTLASTTNGTGTNPITSTSITTSSYFVIDLGANDMIANISCSSQGEGNSVKLPYSGNIEALVATNKYTLEGFAKVAPLSLTITDYVSNFSVDAESWVGTGTSANPTGNNDGISDGVLSYDNVLKHVTSGTNVRLNKSGFTNEQNYVISFKFYLPSTNTQISGVGLGGNYQAQSAVISATVGTYSEGQFSAAKVTNAKGAWGEVKFFYRPTAGTTTLFLLYFDDAGNQVSNPTSPTDEFYMYDFKRYPAPNIVAQIGSKSVSINPTATTVLGAFTKFVLNFEATAAEVSQDLKMYLNGAGSVYVDKLSLTQAYDFGIYFNVKQPTILKDYSSVFSNGSGSGVHSGVWVYFAKSSNTLIFQWQDGIGSLHRNFATTAVFTNFLNSFTKISYTLERTLSTGKIYINKNLITNANGSILIGKELATVANTIGVFFSPSSNNFFNGLISNLKLLRFTNIGLSNFDGTTYDFNTAVTGGGAEVVALWDWRGNTDAKMLKDKSEVGNDLSPNNITLTGDRYKVKF